MRAQCRQYLVVVIAGVVLGAASPARPAAEPALRLAGVPERLALPLPNGSNLVLTATVTGGAAKSVWLARGKEAKARFSLTRTGPGEYQVNLADPEAVAVLDASGDRGQFQVFAELDGGKLLASLPVRYVMPAAATLPKPPKKLKLAGNVVSVLAYQRRSCEVPGSDKALFIELGDITHGQVHVSVRTADYKNVVPPTSLRQGESLALDLGEEQYVLYVRELVNVLIGTDWAVLDLARMQAGELKKIERLLARIVASEVRFLREGQEHSGKEAAEHLRQKLSVAGPRIVTLNEFIDKLASRSATTGKPYEVKLPDGKTVPAKEWLETTSAQPDEPPKDKEKPAPK
jgi:hypothetical protein